jgi:hypothetical protein
VLAGPATCSALHQPTYSDDSFAKKIRVMERQLRLSS